MRLKVIASIVIAAGISACSSESKKSDGNPATPTAPVSAAATTAKTPPAADAKAVADDSAKTTWRCSKGTEVRTIQIASREPKGCRLLYPNAENEVASSAVSDAHCIQVRSKVRGNLEKAGFTCTNGAG